MADGHPIETLVWADARCVDTVAQVLGRMKDVHVLAVGGPRKAQITELATQFDAPAEDDLRKMLVDRPAAYLLLATATGVSSADLAQARQTSTVTLAIEPPAFAFDAEPLRSNGLPAVVTLPWLRQSRTFLAAADPHEALGTPHTVNITAVGPPRTGSLLSRLYDALETAIHLLGMPDVLDAALSGSPAPGSAPADDLRSLSGHLTAHLRFSGDRAAMIQVSDRAPAWLRRIVATGSEGLFDWSDTAYRLTAPDGHVLDEVTAESSGGDALPAVQLMLHQWQRLLDGSTSPAATPSRQVLACCHAAALSCRTGQHESPATFLRLSEA